LSACDKNSSRISLDWHAARLDIKFIAKIMPRGKQGGASASDKFGAASQINQSSLIFALI